MSLVNRPKSREPISLTPKEEEEEIAEEVLAWISRRDGCIGPWNLRKFFYDKGLLRFQRRADANRVYLAAA